MRNFRLPEGNNPGPPRRRLRLNRQPHPVMGRHDACGEALTQHFVIVVRMHVGDDGTARLETVDPGERVAEMAGVRGIALRTSRASFECSSPVVLRRATFRERTQGAALVHRDGVGESDRPRLCGLLQRED